MGEPTPEQDVAATQDEAAAAQPTEESPDPENPPTVSPASGDESQEQPVVTENYPETDES